MVIDDEQAPVPGHSDFLSMAELSHWLDSRHRY